MNASTATVVAPQCEDPAALVALTYGACNAPGGWQRWLSGVAAAVDAVAASLVVREAAGRVAERSAPRELGRIQVGSPPLVRGSNDAQPRCGEADWRRHSALRPGTLVTVTDPPERDADGALWSPVRTRRRVHGAVVVVARDGDRITCIELWRAASKDRIGVRSRELLEQLIPHLRAALVLQERLSVLEARPACPLPGFPRALYCVDASGRVLRRAPELALHGAGPTPLAPDGEGRLASVASGDTARLRTAVARASTPSGTLEAWTLEGSSEVVAVTAGRPLPLPWLCCAFVALYGAWPIHVDRGILARVYGLSGGEARVVAELMRGSTPPECARRLGLGHETVRTHLKRALAKTGTHRQAELLWLLRTGPGAGSSAPHPGSVATSRSELAHGHEGRTPRAASGTPGCSND